MQKKYQIGSSWTDKDKMFLHQQGEFLISPVMVEADPTLNLRNHVQIPLRTIVTVPATVLEPEQLASCNSSVYEFCAGTPEGELPIGLNVQGMIHLRGDSTPEVVPVTLINSTHQNIWLTKGTPLGTLQKVSDFGETTIADLIAPVANESDQLPTAPAESRTISSPTNADQHTKIEIPSVQVSDETKTKLQALCDEFKGIFSLHSGDIGHIKLITMDIDMRDYPPIAQWPYNLPLKHLQWVKEELETLEKAGVIARSVSPWVSPIVIVPKHLQPGEPPQWRLCVDYRVQKKGDIRRTSLQHHLIKSRHLNWPCLGVWESGVTVSHNCRIAQKPFQQQGNDHPQPAEFTTPHHHNFRVFLTLTLGIRFVQPAFGCSNILAIAEGIPGSCRRVASSEKLGLFMNWKQMFV